MAAAQYAMGSRPAVKTEQFDMDSFFDFNQGTTQPSPVTASSSRSPKNNQQDWNTLSPFDQVEERQQFNGPSHDYNQYKQQVGLPVGSMQNMPMNTHPAMFDGYNSGIDMNMDGGFGAGWSSGIDMDAEMSMDFNQPPPMPAMFFPSTHDTQTDSFINPNTIGGQEEPPSNVGRLWPGMHSQQAQQAAMAKAAQAQAVQQRQLKLQAQQQQYRQAANAAQSQRQGSYAQQGNANGKRPSHVTEPHVEESISRLLNQMRNNSTVSDDAGSPGNVLPHIARMRKEEEEMDDDERLLASDEGKKLSSKERRQLRNKVSARAFRSRRKEYIGQLEGEVAMKAQEANTLRSENTALLQENERYRGLIETLLRHPAFTPFINDLSKDPSSLSMLPQQQQTAPQPTPAPQQQQQQSQQQPQQPSAQDTKPEFLNFDASQLQLPSQPAQQPQQQQPQQTERVGLAMIPDNDFSKLNLNSFQQSMNYGFQSVNAFAVTGLPTGPDPLDLLIEAPLRPLSPAHGFDFASAAAPSPAANSDMTLLLAKLDSSARRLDGSVVTRAPV